MKKVKIRIKQFGILLKTIYYYLYCKIKRINNEEVWVISERGDEARDNGYAFFRYIKESHPEINVKYIIHKKSRDIINLEKYKEDIIYYRTKKHYILFFTAGKLISTHIMGFSPDFRSFNKLDKLGLIKTKGKRIFLQHGIIKDYLEGLMKKNVNLDLFICGAKPEYDYLLKILGFSAKVMKYTGLARYDYLEKIEDNVILLMPTWRDNLYYCSNNKSFQRTTYYKKYQELINNEELDKILEQEGLKLIFYPHYEIQEHIQCFSTRSNHVIIAKKSEYDVQDLLKRARMLITDYSSIFFDIAYMNKPVIYYQFDYEEYRNEHYKEGYFSYKDHGFGPVTPYMEEVLKYIEMYIKKNYTVEEKYKHRKREFFVFQDKKNSERIFQEIKKIKGRSNYEI